MSIDDASPNARIEIEGGVADNPRAIGTKAICGSAELAYMVLESMHNRRIAIDCEEVMAAILVADLGYHVHILGLVTGWVEGPDEGHGLGVRKGVDLCVEVRVQ